MVTDAESDPGKRCAEADESMAADSPQRPKRRRTGGDPAGGFAATFAFHVQEHLLLILA